jgi:uncharacterized protein YdeI (YjbR/CyaY-like superfamily)
MRSVTPKWKLVNMVYGPGCPFGLNWDTAVIRNENPVFKTAADFRAWLQENHGNEAELTVGFCKKSSRKPSVTYSEAVDEALCFGWIDGVRNSIDADTYRIRFTPRKPRSQWSAVNIQRMRGLIEQGRVTPAGHAAFAGAETQPRAYSYEQRNGAKFDAASERRFHANKTAWEFFQTQPPWYRRTATFWVISAKKEETRQRRLDQLIAESARSRSIKPLEHKPPSRSGTRKS